MKLFLSILLLISLLSSCSHTKKNPGICISFDDRSIHEWSTLKPLLNSYNAHVTFFVTQFDSLTHEEIQLLKDLQSDGHEIGSHGAMHVLSETYIKEHSYNEWLEKEIDADIANLKGNGFNPTSFAYPYGAKYWFTDHLLKQRFEIVRSVAPLTDPIEDIDDIFYDFDNDRTLSAIGFDKDSGMTEEKIERALNRAVQQNEVLMIYAHIPGDGNGNSSFDVKFLEKILAASANRGMTFYRFNDLSGD
ncbi:MAG: polysaccharide deacetylase family protein [Bacteroidota bacterium]